MYCNHCGKPNPDGSKFCSSCGQPIVTAPTAQPAPRPAAASSGSKEAPNNTLANFRSHFRISWREFAAKPFALVMLILYSINTLVGLVQVNEILEPLESTLYLAGLFFSDFASDGSFLLTLIQILICAPGVLITVGLWITYIDALDHSDRALNSMGLAIIYWVYMVLFVGTCLCILLSFFMLVEAEAMTGSVLIILAIFTLLFVLLFRMVFCLISGIRDTMQCCEPATDYVQGMAIFEFIVGGLCILGLFASSITFIGLLSSALPIMFGIMLIRYKGFMEEIYYEREALKASERRKATPWA